MKRAECSGPGQPIVIAEVPDPKPGPGQAVIKVARCGICSSDLHATAQHGFMPPGYPFGHEVAGEVVEVGAGVTRLKVGDRVAPLAAQGGCGKCMACISDNPVWCTNQKPPEFILGYTEYLAVSEWGVLKLPSSYSMADGALIEPLACSLHGVNMGSLSPGRRVLVIGAGPIGLGAIYWSRRMGAGRIAAMARSNQKAEMAHAMGADVFLSGPDAAQQIASQLGGPPDVVLECTGAQGMLAQSLDFVAPRGSVIMLGACGTPDTFVPTAGTMKEAIIRFVLMYGLKDYETVAESFERGQVDPRLMLTDTISLLDLPQAFDTLRQANGHCKVLVDPWAAPKPLRAAGNSMR